MDFNIQDLETLTQNDKQKSIESALEVFAYEILNKADTLELDNFISMISSSEDMKKKYIIYKGSEQKNSFIPIH